MERMKGYRDALREAEILLWMNIRYARGILLSWDTRGVKRLMKLPDPPTAVILSNYDTTLGGIMAINESGLNCPGDISIIGFDDILMTKVIRPKLWIMVQPMEEMSKRAIEMLLNRITKKEEGVPIRISFSARMREGNSIRKM